MEVVAVVGYALPSKKIKSFVQPKFQRLARSKGIIFMAIDQSRPLSDQGPFAIVLHKLSGKEWRRVLEDYQNTHPEVTVLDPPEAIHQLQNRQSMLQDVADLNLSSSYGKVGVPKQLVIKEDASFPFAVDKARLRLPIVAKPLFAKSHDLSLAYDEFSLQMLEPPVVLQEFINHGGVLFKIYVVGEAIKVVRRFSLPNISKSELSNTAGVYRFPRVSCAAASADEGNLDPHVAELPPRPLLERLARELRLRLGLRLFNMDIIQEYGTKDHYYVIDINYFPGYGKMPEYEPGERQIGGSEYCLEVHRMQCSKTKSITLKRSWQHLLSQQLFFLILGKARCCEKIDRGCTDLLVSRYEWPQKILP